eukprot:260569-Rhodomonas_salina.1
MATGSSPPASPPSLKPHHVPSVSGIATANSKAFNRLFSTDCTMQAFDSAKHLRASPEDPLAWTCLTASRCYCSPASPDLDRVWGCSRKIRTGHRIARA